MAPLLWATVVTCAYVFLDLRWLAIPTLPLTSIGVAVAFYLGFKNNASYDRLWEARTVWGGIVNASRSWAISARDLIEGTNASEELVARHVAWLDALRHQLRQLKPWEHRGPVADHWRDNLGVVEYSEDLEAVLSANLDRSEVTEALANINPAAHILSNQSRCLAELRRCRPGNNASTRRTRCTCRWRRSRGLRRGSATASAGALSRRRRSSCRHR